MSHWIGLNDWRDDAVLQHGSPWVFLRKSSSQPLRLRIACCLRYCVLSGTRLIHEGPARALPGEAFLDSIDLSGLHLDPHEWLAVVVMPPIGTAAAEVHTRIGILAEVDLESGQSLATDGEWTVRRFDEVGFHGRLCSLPTSQQEHWTVREPLSLAWDRPAEPARVLGSQGTPPWQTLRPRDCAVLVREPLSAELVFSGRDGGSVESPDADLARAFNGAELTAVSDAPPGSSGAVVLNAARNVVAFDVGRTRRVRPCISLLQDGSSSGAGRIEVFYDIGFVGRPTASLGFESPREGFVDSIEFDSPGSVSEWRPLVPRGARYVTIRFAAADESASCAARVDFEAVEYPAVALPTPTFDRPVLTQIWDRSVATLRSSSDDVLVDTCWRENVLWTFDAAVSGEAHYLAFGDPAMWRRCLGLVARWAAMSGPWPTSVVPAGASGVILPDQGLFAITSFTTFAAATGDDEFARTSVPMFERFLTACMDCVTADGLFVPPDWCWHWIDWAPVDRRAYSLPANLLLAAACETAAAWVEPGPFAARCRQVAGTIRALSNGFWDDAAGCYRDRIAPARELPPPNQVVPMPSADFSAHSNALALRFAVAGPERRARIGAYLAAHLEALPFSPGWTGVVLGALADHGHADAAADHLVRLYGPWLDADQPTWSEGFGQTQYNTAHAWGASALAVLTRLAKLMARPNQHETLKPSEAR